MTPLLKNVVTASGGQVRVLSVHLLSFHRTQFLPTLQLKEVQKLTPRIISGSPERYAVSSQEDVSVWRQLAEAGTPVYSVELIISGTLKQTFDPESARLEWTDED